VELIVEFPHELAEIQLLDAHAVSSSATLALGRPNETSCWA
jgi:hypothetical protein